jgi:hypothetical protein
MATTGDPSVGQPSTEVMRSMGGPPATSREEVMDPAVRNMRVVGSPVYPIDEPEVRQRWADLRSLVRQVGHRAAGNRRPRHR